MTITDELRKNLTNPNPLYVAAGTADLAVQKLRELPATVDRLRAEAPERLPRLREQATGLALQGVGIALEYAVKARETYDELAERGRTLVESRLGGPAEPATEVTVERAEAEPGDAPITEPVTEPRAGATAADAKADAKAKQDTAGTAGTERKAGAESKAAKPRGGAAKAGPKARSAPRKSAPRTKGPAGEEQPGS